MSWRISVTLARRYSSWSSLVSFCFVNIFIFDVRVSISWRNSRFSSTFFLHSEPCYPDNRLIISTTVFSFWICCWFICSRLLKNWVYYCVKLAYASLSAAVSCYMSTFYASFLFSKALMVVFKCVSNILWIFYSLSKLSCSSFSFCSLINSVFFFSSSWIYELTLAFSIFDFCKSISCSSMICYFCDKMRRCSFCNSNFIWSMRLGSAPEDLVWTLDLAMVCLRMASCTLWIDRASRRVVDGVALPECWLDARVWYSLKRNNATLNNFGAPGYEHISNVGPCSMRMRFIFGSVMPCLVMSTSIILSRCESWSKSYVLYLSDLLPVVGWSLFLSISEGCSSWS